MTGSLSYHEQDTALREGVLEPYCEVQFWGEAHQIIGEAAICSVWTRMEGQGSWNV